MPRLDVDVPTTRASRDVFVTGSDTPAGVLAAMVAEGLLVPVTGGVHVAADRAGLPASRAAAAAAVLGPHLTDVGVIGGATALWVRGLVAVCPASVVVHVVPARARSAPRRPGVTVRSTALDEADVVDLGGVRVTSLARTGADLARTAVRPPREVGTGYTLLSQGVRAAEDAVTALLALVLRAGTTCAEVEAQLDARWRSPGNRAARHRLRAARRLVDGAPPGPRTTRPGPGGG